MSPVGGLPIVPDLSCPSAAAALAASGLDTACKAASTATSAAASAVTSAATDTVGSVGSQLAGFGVDSVLGALGSWVIDGATWLLSQIGAVLSTTTSIDLGASWFTSHYETMAALAGVVIVPMLLLGIMQSVYRQSGSMLIRSVVVNVPLALLLTAVAVKLVSLGLAVTDAMSNAVSHGSALDTSHFLSSVTNGLSAGAAGDPSGPTFVLFLGGLVVVFGALMVWVELLIRSAAIYVAVLFLPLVLASLAWPAVSHWCRRLVDTLVALVLGKFVIVAVLSLASGALAGGVGAPTSGGSSGGGAGGASGGSGFAAVLGGAALLLLASFAPWALFRLLPFLEAGAVGHLEGLSHRARQTAGVPVRGLAVVAMRATVGGSVIGTAAGITGSIGSRVGTLGAGALSTGPDSGIDGGPGGDGPPGTRPEPEPSFAELTGVGTMDSTGHDIPAWAVHPEATAAARRYFGDLPGGDEAACSDLTEPAFPSLLPASTALPPTPADAPGSHPAASAASAASAGSGSGSFSEVPPSFKPLPRQSGALRPDILGRDDLGVRLMAAPQLPGPAFPPGRTPPVDPSRAVPVLDPVTEDDRDG